MEIRQRATPIIEDHDNTSVINYIYIGIVLLHGVFNLITGVDGMGRIQIVATVIVLFMSAARYHKRILNAPYLIWWIWCAYAIINTEIKGGLAESTNPLLMYTYIISGALVFFLSAIEYECNSKRFLRFLFITLSVYLITGCLDMSDVEFGDTTRTLSSFGNMLPITGALFIYIIMFQFIKKEISIKIVIISLIVITMIIFMSATRKAFGAALIILTFYFLSYIVENPKSSIRNIAFIFLLCLVVSNLMEDSVLSNRFEVGMENAGSNEYTSNIFLKLLDDRAIMYVKGWEIFLDNWLTGIGLFHFREYTGHSHVLHSEYMVQLAECGIIGFTLFVTLYIYILRRLLSLLFKRKGTQIVLFNIGMIMAILFISFTAWTFQFVIHFICLGTAMGYLNVLATENETEENTDE